MSTNQLKIHNLAGFTDEIVAGSLSSSTLQADTATLGSVKTNGLHTFTVVGYAPTSWATLPVGASVNILNVAGEVPATTGSDARLLQIPDGAIIKDIYVDDNGVTNAGSATFNVNLETFNVTPTGSGSPQLLSGAATPLLSSFGVARDAFTAATLVGTPGLKVQVGSNQVVATNNSGAALTAGDLRMFITYIVPL